MTQKNRPDRAIAERVFQAREEAGLSKTEFAEKLGLSKQGYNHYEQFTTPFTVEQLFQASRILNRPVEYFLGLDTDPLPEVRAWSDRLRAMSPSQRAKTIHLVDGILGIAEGQ